MALTLLTANMVVQWAMSKANPPFAPTKQGTDGVEYNLADLNAIFDKLYVASTPVAGSADFTLDLTVLEDLVNDPINFSKVLFVFVLPQGSGVNVAPGAANGLDLFNTGADVDVPENGALFYGGDPAGTGIVVDGTHKTLLFTNLSADALTVEIVIAGDG